MTDKRVLILAKTMIICTKAIVYAFHSHGHTHILENALISGRQARDHVQAEFDEMLNDMDKRYEYTNPN